MNTGQAYVTTPVLQHPKRPGWYYVLNINREILPRMVEFRDGRWQLDSPVSIYFYLNPVDLVAEKIETATEAFDAGVKYAKWIYSDKKHETFPLNKHWYIQNLKSSLTP